MPFLKTPKKDWEMSSKGIKILQDRESLDLEPYHDVSGYPTIGWGHLLSQTKWAPLSRWKRITRAEADKLLVTDIGKALNAVRRGVRVPLTQHMFDSLGIFTYNVGNGGFLKSTLLKELNKGEYFNAVEEMVKWNFSGGKEVRGLMIRRLKTCLHFMSQRWE